MKSILILVGKTTNKHFAAGIKDYTERIGHYMPFEIITIPEIKNTKSLSEEQQKEREGELILKQLQASDTLVLLDEHGAELRSIELAQWLEKRQQTSRRLVFVIRFLSRCLSTSQRQAEPLATYLLAPDGASGIYRTALSCLHYNKR